MTFVLKGELVSNLQRVIMVDPTYFRIEEAGLIQSRSKITGIRFFM